MLSGSRVRPNAVRNVRGEGSGQSSSVAEQEAADNHVSHYFTDTNSRDTNWNLLYPGAIGNRRHTHEDLSAVATPTVSSGMEMNHSLNAFGGLSTHELTSGRSVAVAGLTSPPSFPSIGAAVIGTGLGGGGERSAGGVGLGGPPGLSTTYLLSGQGLGLHGAGVYGVRGLTAPPNAQTGSLVGRAGSALTGGDSRSAAGSGLGVVPGAHAGSFGLNHDLTRGVPSLGSGLAGTPSVEGVSFVHESLSAGGGAAVAGGLGETPGVTENPAMRQILSGGVDRHVLGLTAVPPPVGLGAGHRTLDLGAGWDGAAVRNGLSGALPVADHFGGGMTSPLTSGLEGLVQGLREIPGVAGTAIQSLNDICLDPDIEGDEKNEYERWLALIKGGSATSDSYPKKIKPDEFRRLYGKTPLPCGGGDVTVTATGLFYREHEGLESGSIAASCQIKDLDVGSFSVNLVSPAAGKAGSGYFTFAYKGTEEAVQGFVSKKEFDKVAGSIFKGKYIRTMFDKSTDAVIAAEDERAKKDENENIFGEDNASHIRRRARFVIECSKFVIKRLEKVVEGQFALYTPALEKSIYNFYEEQSDLKKTTGAVDPRFAEMELALGHLYAMKKTYEDLKKGYEENQDIYSARVDNLRALVVSSALLEELPGYMDMGDRANTFNSQMSVAAGESLAERLCGICKGVGIESKKIAALQDESEIFARAESMAQSQTILKEFSTPRISKQPFSNEEKDAFKERYGYAKDSARINFDNFRILRVDGPDGVYFANGVGIENAKTFSAAEREDNVSVLFKGDCNRNAYVYLKGTPDCCVLVQKLEGGAVRIDFENIYVKNGSSSTGYSPVKLKDLKRSFVGAYEDVIKKSFKDTRICASSEYVVKGAEATEVVQVSKAIMYDGKVFDNFGLRKGLTSISNTQPMPGVIDSGVVERSLESMKLAIASRDSAFTEIDNSNVFKESAVSSISRLLERESVLITRVTANKEMEPCGAKSSDVRTPAALDQRGGRVDDVKVKGGINWRRLSPFRYKGDSGRGM